MLTQDPTIVFQIVFLMLPGFTRRASTLLEFFTARRHQKGMLIQLGKLIRKLKSEHRGVIR